MSEQNTIILVILSIILLVVYLYVALVRRELWTPPPAVEKAMPGSGQRDGILEFPSKEAKSA